MGHITEKDETQLVNILKNIEPGFLPYPVFEQIARIIALPILEVIPVRHNHGKTEVLLIERPADDPFWPSLLHTPGTVVRATDLNTEPESNWKALDRVLKDELEGTATDNLHFVGNQLRKSKRGVEQAQLFWIEVIGKPHVGLFYDVDNLPDTLIESQVAFINQASQNYKNWRVAKTSDDL